MSQLSVSGQTNIQPSIDPSVQVSQQNTTDQVKSSGRVFERLGDSAASALKALFRPIQKIFSSIQESSAKQELSKALKDYKAAVNKSGSSAELSKLINERGSVLKNLVTGLGSKGSESLNKLMEDVKLTETQKGLHLEILDLQKRLESTSLNQNEKNEIQRELQAKVTAFRMSKIAPEKAIAKGKAKQVYAKKTDSENVYFTPVKGLKEKIIGSKKKEIEEELATAGKIKSNLKAVDVSSEDSNLALDMEVVTKEDQVGGRFTVKTKKAEGDLAKFILLKKMSFPQSARIGFQVANGMNNLHKAGFCHGDSKPENILVYDSGRKDANGNVEYDVRISDFGKTKEVPPGVSVMHTGNPRFAAPEGRLSQKAEVYSSAIMILHTLEGELLDAAHPMVKEPMEKDKGVNSKGRYGIEKFLVENRNTPQSEVRSLGGKAKVYGRTAQIEMQVKLGIKDSPGKLQKAEDEVHLYISHVMTQLIDKHPDKSVQILQLGTLLKEMTNSDPEKRPSMEQVKQKYQKIMNSL